MRPIKYRAWDKTKKKMTLVADISFGDDGSARTTVFQPAPKDTYYYGLVEGESGTLMQFTGLFDKHGREVYEDDIVRDNAGDIYAIRWDRHLARFAFYSHDASKKGSNKEWRSAEETITDFDMKARFEIIGNVHENPGLLEVGQ